MFKVIISNTKLNKSWTGLSPNGEPFSSEAEAQAWLDQQIGKPHRLPERIESIDSEYDQDDVLEVIETEQVIGYNAVPRVDGQNQPVLDAEGIQIVDQVPNTAMVQTHVRLKAEYTAEIQDISAQYNAEQDKINKIKAGAAARQACQNVLDFIAGENLARSLTSEQITSMQSTFANIQASLQASRPSLAKSLIQAVSVDGVIVTQALKDGCLDLLSAY